MEILIKLIKAYKIKMTTSNINVLFTLAGKTGLYERLFI